MPLNLNTTGGDFTPYIKYNAKAGRWFVRAENGDVEVPSPRFVMDFEKIKLGWICFPQSGAPISIWDVQGVRAPRPEGKYKDGFEVMVYGAERLPALGNEPLGWRQWMSNSIAAKSGISAAYSAFELEQAANPNKVPVFQHTGIIVMHTDFGDNYEPTLALESWVEKSKLPLPPEQGNGAAPAYDAAQQGPAKPIGHGGAESDFDDEIPF